MSQAPERELVVPLRAVGGAGITTTDYSGVPTTVTFGAAETSKAFTFSATQDSVDDDDETVTISFGTLPTGITEGAVNETVVSIDDDDNPTTHSVMFAAASYGVDEGDTVTVSVELGSDAETELIVPLSTTDGGGATSADYSGVPTSVTFAVNANSVSFTFSATQDSVDDDDETVTISFGTLPTGVAEGTVDETVVSIGDDDAPASVSVMFAAATYAVDEGDTVTVSVELSQAPERELVVPLSTTDGGGATSADYLGVPTTVTFGAAETSKAFTFTATQDSVDDDDETVTISFGTLPTGVAEGTVAETVVSIGDDDAPASVSVMFAAATYAVDEGDTVTVSVELSQAPERELVVPLSTTDGGGATSADYSGVPTTVTFGAAETSKAFTFSATQDSVDDDDETVTISFGTLPTGVAEGTVDETVVSIGDDDAPASVSVMFAAATYAVDEGDTVTVSVELSQAPERELVVPLSTTDGGGATSADYSGVPTTVTFGAAETSKAFTFSATQDSVDDDDETVTISFGTLPTGVAEGTVDETVVSIGDDDAPASVSVMFAAATYAVDEGDTVTVSVELSQAPERELVVPLSTTDGGGATSADYSGVPESVTFAEDATSVSFTFTATQDSVDDDDETVTISFGTLPTGITEGAVDETEISIDDDGRPGVGVG